jgi:DNA polymerase-3 subunit alpha
MYLNCHSYFSLRYGTFAPEDLPGIAKSYGVDALVFSVGSAKAV